MRLDQKQPEIDAKGAWMLCKRWIASSDADLRAIELPDLALVGENHFRRVMPERARPAVIYRPANATDGLAWAALRHELWPECPRERHELEVEQLLAANGLVVFAERRR
jgi:hypothetical protein